MLIYYYVICWMRGGLTDPELNVSLLFPSEADMAPEAGAGNRQNDAGAVPEKKIRKEFPETWLWVDTEAE